MYLKLRIKRIVNLFVLLGLLAVAGMSGTHAAHSGQVAAAAVQKNTLPAGSRIPGLQVTLIESGLFFSLQTPAYQIETNGNKAQSCQRIVAEGYTIQGRSGEPALPVAGLMAGIPAGAVTALELLEVEWKPVPGVSRLCPVPTPQVERDAALRPFSSGEALVEDAATYARFSWNPDAPVVVGPAAYIRNQRVAQIRFSPFRYNPSSGELQVVSRMQGRFTYPPQQSQPSSDRALPVDGAFDALYQNALINYEQSRPWRISSGSPAAGEAAGQAAQAAQTRYKIQVNQDGLYELSYAYLQAAGLPLGGIDPRTFRLHNMEVETAIHVNGEQDGVFDPGDSILFYGQMTNTRFTTTNVYWLSWGAGNGLRMVALDGSGDGTAPLPYRRIVRMEEDHLYMSYYPSGPAADRWYWEIVSGSEPNVPVSVNYTFQATNIAAVDVKLRGLLKGYLGEPQHHTRIYLNSSLVDDQIWPSEAELSLDKTLASTMLVEGLNTLRLELPMDGGITFDMLFTNWFEIEYSRMYRAENNRLVFGGDQAGTWKYQVGGFTTSAIDVYDITNPKAPVIIQGGLVTPDGPAYQVAFRNEAATPRRFLALTRPARLAPASISEAAPVSLKSSTNGADYIIISHPDFLAAVQPLADWRAAQKLRVKVVDVNQVYDEFNGGVFDPAAIKNFLAYTYQSWQAPAPAYVVLVGDGHYDFKFNYGPGNPNFIPPLLGDFDPWIGETAADNRFVTVSGSDILPDMYIGRLPVTSAAEATAVVGKILAYEQPSLPADWQARIAFVADNADSGGNFAAYSDVIANNYLPAAYTAEKIYYKITHQIIGETQTAILNSINQGRLIVNYTGHAGVQFWANEQLFSVAAIANLTNAGKYPLFLPMSCQEGYFIYPTATGWNYPSLAESLVRAANKGAIATFSPAGFGLASGHDYLSRGFYEAVFTNHVTRMGAAVTLAKYYLYTNSVSFNDLIDTYTFFGDPATPLRIVLPWKSFQPLVGK